MTTNQTDFIAVWSLLPMHWDSEFNISIILETEILSETVLEDYDLLSRHSREHSINCGCKHWTVISKY